MLMSGKSAASVNHLFSYRIKAFMATQGVRRERLWETRSGEVDKEMILATGRKCLRKTVKEVIIMTSKGICRRSRCRNEERSDH